MNKEKLQEILAKHLKWLKNEIGGKKANLSGADLSGANLSGADLNWANLSGADLNWANLCGANLCGANLSGADLNWANLCGANLHEADLRRADLHEADLSRADLHEADLSRADLHEADLSRADLHEADLSGADLRRADLSGADLHGAKNVYNVIWDIHTFFYPLQCPEKGEYIGYKKADNKIVELLIPADAKRSSATSRKCRASKAKVISITHCDGSEYDFNYVASDYNGDFIYRVGAIVEVPDFDENRWNECAPGIHHFITREEAVKYS